MQRSIPATICAAALLAFAPAMAQTSGSSSTTNAPGSQGPSPGVTSGPAAGTPATLGTGGETPTTPHQQSALRNRGGKTIQREQQAGAGGASQAGHQGKSDAGSGKTAAPHPSNNTQ